MGSPIDCRWMAPSASARSPARRAPADPAHSCSRGWVRLRGAQWGRRGSSDHGRTAPTAATSTTSEPVVLADGRHLSTSRPWTRTDPRSRSTSSSSSPGRLPPRRPPKTARNPRPQRLLHPQRELPAADPARAGRRAHYGECARRPVHWQLDQGRLGDAASSPATSEQRDGAVLDHRGAGPGDQDRPAIPAVGTSRARRRVRQWPSRRPKDNRP